MSTWRRRRRRAASSVPRIRCLVSPGPSWAMRGGWSLSTAGGPGAGPRAGAVGGRAGGPSVPAAGGRAFAAFLERVQPDPAMRAFLARLLGHALEGRVVSHVLPIFHGEGGNGKGTLINHAVLPALGDYADAADAPLLTARTFDAHPTAVAALYGLPLPVLPAPAPRRHLP